MVSLGKRSSLCQEGDPQYCTEAVDSSDASFYSVCVKVLTFSVENAGKASGHLLASNLSVIVIYNLNVSVFAN